MTGQFRWRDALIVLGDFMCFNAALLAALFIRKGGSITPDFLVNHLRAFGPLIIIWQTTCFALGIYDLKLFRNSIFMIRNLTIAVCINWALGAMYFYLLTPWLELTPKTHLLLAVLIGHFFLFTARKGWLGAFRSRAFRQRVVILTSDRHESILRREMEQHPELGYVAVSSATANVDLIIADHDRLRRNWNAVIGLLRKAVQKRIPVVTLESFTESIFGQVLLEHACDPAWTIEYVLGRSEWKYSKIKHALDRTAAAVMLVLLSPLLALIWTVIRLVDGSPAFYGQARVGFLGNQFRLWKFRTMAQTPGVETPFAPAKQKVAHMTGLGSLLRRYRLDELPQLWNVLKGEMSFVGTRPEWTREVEVLEKVLPQYNLRHMVRPGITGWAQINFRATDNTRDSMEKLRYDLFYVKNLSFALDAAILLKTVKRVFISDSNIKVQRRHGGVPFISRNRRMTGLGVPIRHIPKERQ